MSIRKPVIHDNEVLIPLTQGFVAIVDREDIDVAMLGWYAAPLSDRTYACRFNTESSWPKKLYLHRVILSIALGRSLSPEEIVDHIDHNTLNNKRSNLRLATASQNCQNTRKGKNNTSGYKGVSFHPRQRLWRARINVHGKQMFLGNFDTPEEAFEAYCVAAQKYYGDFAYLDSRKLLKGGSK